MNQQELAEKLFSEAFAPERMRTPRSPQYRLGVKYGIAACLGIQGNRNPFPLGTCENDAYLAGWDEGAAIVRHRGPEETIR